MEILRRFGIRVNCPVAQGGGPGWSDGVAQGDAEIEGWWGSSSGGWIWIVRRAWTGGVIITKCGVVVGSQ